MRLCSYYFLVLDIETSTQEVNDDFMVWLSYGYLNLYNVKGERIETNFFRDWGEYAFLLKNYGRKFYGYEVLVYVHNLSYEFDFLIKNVSPPDKIMTNSTHNIISGTLQKFPQFRYMCTYQLSGLSLREIGKILNFPKLESDYHNYFPEDEIDETDKEYCCRDCDIVAKYIVETQLKEYSLLKNIPYTKTGRVRKRLKEHYKEYVKEHGYPDWDLMPDEQCYEAMKRAFSGGVVISSLYTTNVVINNVRCFDITSSYPYAMLKEEFPYTIEKADTFTVADLETTKFWIAKIRFYNITSKFTWQWLSISKMDYFDVNSEFFNGKLMCSPLIERTITSVDYDIIKMTYDFSDIEVLEFYPCKKYSKIPEPYEKTILEVAEKKHSLKEKREEMKKNGVSEEDEEYREISKEYMLAKNDFNSIYGMLVQDLVQNEFYVDENFIWHKKDVKYKQSPKHIGRNFLFGIFVTAYARRNVLRGAVINCPETLCYIDTDSIKFIGDFHFQQTNELLDEKYLCNPAVSDLGQFDDEGTYLQYKTLGAKKYAYVSDDGKVRLTVAGLPKQKGKGEYYIDKIEDFSPNTTFKKCKMGKKYVVGNTIFEYDYDTETMTNKKTINWAEVFCHEHNVLTGGGVVLTPVDYALDMTKNDKMHIEHYDKMRPMWIDYLTQKYKQDFVRYFE